jgi:hypothetical protein
MKAKVPQKIKALLPRKILFYFSSAKNKLIQNFNYKLSVILIKNIIINFIDMRIICSHFIADFVPCKIINYVIAPFCIFIIEAIEYAQSIEGMTKTVE